MVDGRFEVFVDAIVAFPVCEDGSVVAPFKATPGAGGVRNGDGRPGIIEGEVEVKAEEVTREEAVEEARIELGENAFDVVCDGACKTSKSGLAAAAAAADVDAGSSCNDGFVFELELCRDDDS